MLIVTYDNDKDAPVICVMKAGENLNNACLKMELGEQAKLLYRALTEQDFKIEPQESEDNMERIDSSNLRSIILTPQI